jgi:hypothetical protein
MSKPSYASLYSFVFSLLLTSAMIPSAGNVSLAAAGAPAAQMAATAVLNGLRAQGLPGGADLALPAPASTPAAAPTPVRLASDPALNPTVLQKVLAMMVDKGVDRELLATVANPLGLTATGQTWASRSLTFKQNDGVLHGFYISRGSEQDLVISDAIPGKSMYVYRAHRDGTASAAIVMDLQTRAVTTRDPSEAQQSLNAEWALWTQTVANQTTASN